MCKIIPCSRSLNLGGSFEFLDSRRLVNTIHFNERRDDKRCHGTMSKPMEQIILSRLEHLRDACSGQLSLAMRMQSPISAGQVFVVAHRGTMLREMEIVRGNTARRIYEGKVEHDIAIESDSSSVLLRCWRTRCTAMRSTGFLCVKVLYKHQS